MSADAGCELLLVSAELEPVVSGQFPKDSGVVAFKRRREPALLAEGGVEIWKCQGLEPAAVLVQLDVHVGIPEGAHIVGVIEVHVGEEDLLDLIWMNADLGE